jgi:bacterioferritin
MPNELWIEMLNEDMRGEHMAIVQYLLGAYALGEGAIAGEVEAVARDEMRHYDWLADKIVELGGRPTIERNPPQNTTDGVENMRLNVAAEDDAIALYEKHIAAIDDEAIQRTLRRIVDDETHHRAVFVKLVAEVASAAPAVDPAPAPADPPAVPDAVSADVLATGIRHEYAVVLQYLQHSFLTGDCPVGRELEMQAINEMQHLGWLAEKLQEEGIAPVVEHGEVDQSDETVAMLVSDICAERAVTQVYEQDLKRLTDPKLIELIGRIRRHEIYHDSLFSGILAELKSEPPATRPGGYTVGSLKKE